MQNGIWTNTSTVTLTVSGGGSTTSISAHQATYVGTFYATANGQTGMAFTPSAASGGTANILGLYNAYNRTKISAIERDSAASWTYAGLSWRAANNSISNRISWIDGLQQSSISAFYGVALTAGASTGVGTGITLDSVTSTPQVASQYNTNNVNYVTVADSFTPQLGFHFVSAMEVAATATTQTFQGSNSTRQTMGLTINLEM
jgi:hypothetical protein